MRLPTPAGGLPWGVAGALAVCGAVCCFVPLAGLIGYESAAAAGVVGGVAAAVSTHLAVVRGRLPSPLDAPNGPAAVFFDRLLWLEACLLAPLLLLALNMLRVRNCDPLGGLAFWAVIPTVSVAVGHTVALGAAALLPRHTRLQLALVLAVLLAEAGVLTWKLAWHPPIVGHTWLLGYFAGSIYDEALALPTTLKWFRVRNLAEIAAVVLALQLAWAARRGLRRRGLVAGLLAVVGTAGTLHIGGQDLGLGLTRDTVIDRLGGTLETPHFLIHYRPGEYTERQLDELIDDHEFRFHELAEWTGLDPVTWRGRKLESFVYPDRRTKGRLMGSGGTMVARPWTHEMHILWDGYGDTSIAHELAHLFSAQVGAGPLQLATRAGVVPDMGMIEGFAVAADWPASELDPHDATAAMRALDLAPDLRKALSPQGFWSQPGRRAYTSVGSFVRWLMDTRGRDKVLAVYGKGDWEGVYGASLDALVGEWEGWLDTRQLSERQLEFAAWKFRRGSIFQRQCARTIAELDDEAGRHQARREWEQALEIRRRLVELEPRNPTPRLSLARLLAQVDRYDEARQITADLLARPKIVGPQRSRILEFEGDLAWEAAAPADASRTYGQCRAEGGSDGDLRRLAVKQVGAGSPPDIETLARRYLLDEESAVVDLHVLRGWAEAAPGDPLPRYLLGLRLVGRGAYADALPWLLPGEDPAQALPDVLIDEQRALLLGRVYLGLGQLDQARAVYVALESGQSARTREEAAEGLRRVSWMASR